MYLIGLQKHAPQIDLTPHLTCIDKNKSLDENHPGAFSQISLMA